MCCVIMAAGTSLPMWGRKNCPQQCGGGQVPNRRAVQDWTRQTHHNPILPLPAQGLVSLCLSTVETLRWAPFCKCVSLIDCKGLGSVPVLDGESPKASGAFQRPRVPPSCPSPPLRQHTATRATLPARLPRGGRRLRRTRGPLCSSPARPRYFNSCIVCF